MSDVHEVVRHQPDLDQRDDEDQSRRDSAESEQVIDTKEVGADGESGEYRFGTSGWAALHLPAGHQRAPQVEGLSSANSRNIEASTLCAAQNA